MPGSIEPTSIFVNVPFDLRYEPLFVTLVGTLVALGQKPRCVVEVRETGQGRLQRIYDLLSSCPVSIHDLSRMGPPPRFNMPFELGLACSLGLDSKSHEILVLEAKPYRLDRTLSDYKGRDPLIHHNRCGDLVTCLLDIFVSEDPLPTPPALRNFAKILRATARVIKREHGTPDIFRAAPYRAIVSAATHLAVTEGFIAA